MSTAPTSSAASNALHPFYAALEARHLAALTFQEVRRGVTALSRGYVEARDQGGVERALSGRGKRAAFALFYGPLHFAVVRAVTEALGATHPLGRLFDLGCGTGAAGAAWALTCKAPDITGVERNGWALAEARFTWRHFGLSGKARQADATRERLPGTGAGILAAYLLNELDDLGRGLLLPKMLAAARAGAQVLVVEPIARRHRAWWPEWEATFTSAGGRSDTWRLEAHLPERWRLLDKAAGLEHHTLSARSLYLAG